MNNYEQIIQTLQNHQAFKGKILQNEPLALKTTFKIGGNSDLFIKPENYKSFQIVLDTVKKAQTKFFILGGGSNVVFSDSGFNGVVISTQDFADVDFFDPENLPEDIGTVTLKENQVLISCFCGTSIASVVNFCTQNNLSGFEEFAGLPGTVGGALFMNARCFNKSISDQLLFTSYMDFSSEKTSLHKLRYQPSQWDYKKSPFQEGQKFITTATFIVEQKTQEDHQKIDDQCKIFIAERLNKGHFRFPSAGSVFKNNHKFGAPSGKLIDDVQLKGTTIGGAQIAEFHGNFIVNINHATQQDVKDLVQLAQQKVQEKYGFLLEPEIIFVDK